MTDATIPPNIAIYLVKEKREAAERRAEEMRGKSYSGSGGRLRGIAAIALSVLGLEVQGDKGRLFHKVREESWTALHSVLFNLSITLWFLLQSINAICTATLFSQTKAELESRRLIRAVSAVYVTVNDVWEEPRRPGHDRQQTASLKYRPWHALHAVRLDRSATALSRYFSDDFIPALSRVLLAVKAGSALRWKCSEAAVERVERLPVRVPDGFWRSQLRVRRFVYNACDEALGIVDGSGVVAKTGMDDVVSVKELRVRCDALCAGVVNFVIRCFRIRSKLFSSEEAKATVGQANALLSTLRRRVLFLDGMFLDVHDEVRQNHVIFDSRMTLWKGMSVEEATTQKEHLDRTYEQFRESMKGWVEAGKVSEEEGVDESAVKEDLNGSVEEGAEEGEEKTFVCEAESGNILRKEGKEYEEPVTVVFTGKGRYKPKVRRFIEGKEGAERAKRKPIDGTGLLNELMSR